MTTIDQDPIKDAARSMTSVSGHTTHFEPHGVTRLAPSVIPKTRWAKTVDGVWIAYQDFGTGPLTLVFMNGLYSHLEVYWELPQFARFMNRLGAGVRVLHFDRRGTGLSDRISYTPTLESRMDDIRAVMGKWHDQQGEIDILVHAVAYAKREDLDGSFVDTSRDGFALAMDVSAYSLVAMAREARPYLHRGSSIITLSYYGAEKVVTHYNVMGVAKAALEASVRYLAADLGPDGIRVNAISAGPIRTLSAGGIAGFRKLYGPFDEIAPLRAHITIEDVGRTALYLGSDLSSAVTGETVYVDGGFNILGVPTIA